MKVTKYKIEIEHKDGSVSVEKYGSCRNRAHKAMALFLEDMEYMEFKSARLVVYEEEIF